MNTSNPNISKPKILIVDDYADDIHILWEELKLDYEVFAATSGEQALQRIADNRPDLILLDVVMPGMSGHDLCRQLKADPATSTIPIIFITAKDDERDEAEGFALGGVDYISKPFHLAVVRARVETILNLKIEMDLREKLAQDLQKLNEELEGKVEEQVARLRLADEELRSSEATLRIVLENILDLVFITDKKGKFKFVGANVPKIIGYSREDILDMHNVNSLIENVESDFNELDKTGTLHDIEKVIIDQQGNERDYLITVNTVTFKESSWLWTCREITERNKLEKRLRQAYKMEAIGTLAGGIAHDFNNILTPIIGCTDLALESAQSNTKLSMYLNRVMEASIRAKDLVKQILMFSRETEHELAPTQIAMPVKEALRLIRASLPTTVEIRQNILSESLLLADPTQIHQLVMNLCTNAAHAMQKKGGFLDISLLDEEVTTDQLEEYPDLSGGSYVKLIVSDNGHGITPDILDRIYDPFFTTKEKSEGTGMGLSVVHGVVRNHFGSIYVDSKVGEGTTFTVFFPALEWESFKLDHYQQESIPTGNERILVIDDEELIAVVEKNMIESLGYDAVTMTSAREALSLFGEESDDFDLILTDLTMPKMTGLVLAERLREIRKDIPILLCTGYGFEIKEEELKRFGIDGIIFKPILRRQIAEKIRHALDNKTAKAE